MSGTTVDWYDPNLFEGGNRSPNSTPSGSSIGALNGWAGGFPNTATVSQSLGINPTLGALAFGLGTAALGPVGMGLSALNSLGNVANTLSNSQTLQDMNMPMSLGQTIGGFLGSNQYSGSPTNAINAAAQNPTMFDFHDATPVAVTQESLDGSSDKIENATGAQTDPNVGGTSVEKVGYARGGIATSRHRALAHMIVANPRHPVLGALARAALTHYANGGRV